jgi:hypothetical protein
MMMLIMQPKSRRPTPDLFAYASQTKPVLTAAAVQLHSQGVCICGKPMNY